MLFNEFSSLCAKKNIKGILIQEEIDLAEKIKNLGVPLNRIDSGEADPIEEPESIELKNKQQKHEFKDKCLYAYIFRIFKIFFA